MNNDSSKSNLLICDPVEGFCEMPDGSLKAVSGSTNININKKVKVIYFTDPICSSCWGIEPQLRKLKLEYRNEIDVEYRMGGLLPDWSYNSGGISKPSDVAHHWDEVSAYYKMPIDGDVWLEDPLDSSFPPSIAFKAAQLQDPKKAIEFLRELREMVFLRKKNIAKWENIAEAAAKVGLDIETLKFDYNGKGKTLFEEDLKLAKDMGVRGFPTMFFVNEKGQKELVYGSRPYSTYESAMLKVSPDLIRSAYNKSWEELFLKFNSFTVKEFAELSGKSGNESELLLDQLTEQGRLEKYSTKNGAVYTLKKN